MTGCSERSAVIAKWQSGWSLLPPASPKRHDLRASWGCPTPSAGLLTFYSWVLHHPLLISPRGSESSDPTSFLMQPQPGVNVPH